MKYLAFRVDTQAIFNGQVVNGFFVRGQRDTDLNWPMISGFDSMEAAKFFLKDAMITDPVRQTVYGPDGYAMKL